jgi:CDP-diacylglycerol--serine O-phosphatidyltransferase
MNQVIPNALTVGALCAGLTAVRFALIGKWELAVLAVVVAGIFDGLDGRMARLLGGGSRFGAELDSLSDFVSFGVAPALMLYLWSVSQLGGIGWAVALLFAVCCALRLARFNTALTDASPPPYTRNYFTGVPAPAGAGLAMLPMMLTFETEPGIFDRPILSAAVLVVVGLLMVSRVPTFSIKRIKLSGEHMVPTLLLIGLLIAALASAPWTTLIVVGVVYLGSIPVSVITFARARAAYAASALAEPPPPALPSGSAAPSATSPRQSQPDKSV